MKRQSKRAPGSVRDAILAFLRTQKKDSSLAEISEAVQEQLGDVPKSSVRSYLRLNTPKLFKRTGHGRYEINAEGRNWGL